MREHSAWQKGGRLRLYEFTEDKFLVDEFRNSLNLYENCIYCVICGDRLKLPKRLANLSLEKFLAALLR